MYVFRSTLSFVLGGTLFMLLVAQLNHAIFPLHIFCGGLLVTYSAFHLHPRAGFWGIFIVGLLMDARSPIPFGTQGILLLALHTLLFRFRDEFARNETLTRIGVASLANFLYLLVVVVVSNRSAPVHLLDVLAGFVISQAFVIIVTPWFFAAQDRLARFVAPARGGAHIHRARSTWLTR